MRRLTRESFDLDSALVTLPAATDKARRSDIQPLPGWLVGELRTLFAASAACWAEFPSHCPGRVLHADLDAARAAWIGQAETEGQRQERAASDFLRYEVHGPDSPLYVDFHSLRVWYISQLAADPQVDIKTLMRLARHTKPELSLSLYAKYRDANLRAAPERLVPPGTNPV